MQIVAVDYEKIHCRSFILIYISAVHIINFQSYCITFSNEFLEDKKKTTGRRAWTSNQINQIKFKTSTIPLNDRSQIMKTHCFRWDSFYRPCLWEPLCISLLPMVTHSSIFIVDLLEMAPNLTRSMSTPRVFGLLLFIILV